MKRWNESHIIKGVAIFLLLAGVIESVLRGLGMPYQEYRTTYYDPINWFVFVSSLLSDIYVSLLVYGLGIVTGLLHRLYGSYAEDAAQAVEGSDTLAGETVVVSAPAEKRLPGKKGWNWGLACKIVAILYLVMGMAEAFVWGSSLFYADYLSSQRVPFDWFSFFASSIHAVYVAAILFGLGAIVTIMVKLFTQTAFLQGWRKPELPGEMAEAVPPSRGKPDEVAALFGEGP